MEQKEMSKKLDKFVKEIGCTAIIIACKVNDYDLFGRVVGTKDEVEAMHEYLGTKLD